MSLFAFADLIEQNIVVERHIGGGWGAKFAECGIEQDGGTLYTYGSGATPDEAMAEYARAITGQRLVFFAGTDDKVRYKVPVGLQHNPNHSTK